VPRVRWGSSSVYGWSPSDASPPCLSPLTHCFSTRASSPLFFPCWLKNRTPPNTVLSTAGAAFFSLFHFSSQPGSPSRSHSCDSPFFSSYPCSALDPPTLGELGVALLFAARWCSFHSSPHAACVSPCCASGRARGFLWFSFWGVFPPHLFSFFTAARLMGVGSERFGYRRYPLLFRNAAVFAPVAGFWAVFPLLVHPALRRLPLPFTGSCRDFVCGKT